MTAGLFHCKHTRSPIFPAKMTSSQPAPKRVDKARHLTYLSKDRKFFIKYGFSVTTGDAKTQHYFYEKIYSQRGTTVKISEIYHAFETRGRTYIVMEYIDIVKGLMVSLRS